MKKKFWTKSQIGYLGTLKVEQKLAKIEKMLT